jgi:hypothetical protein
MIVATIATHTEETTAVRTPVESNARPHHEQQGNVDKKQH